MDELFGYIAMIVDAISGSDEYEAIDELADMALAAVDRLGEKVCHIADDRRWALRIEDAKREFEEDHE